MFSTEEDGHIMRGNQNFNNTQNNISGLLNNSGHMGACGNFMIGQENDSFMNTSGLGMANNT